VIITRDIAYLEQWGLNDDDAILATDRRQPLIDEAICDPNVFMISGGSGQNTLVMAQWFFRRLARQ
jgi:hypothetical protein